MLFIYCRDSFGVSRSDFVGLCLHFGSVLGSPGGDSYIGAEHRLAVLLNYLRTGCYQHQIGNHFAIRMAQSTVSTVLKETAEGLARCFNSVHVCATNSNVVIHTENILIAHAFSLGNCIPI